MKSPMLLTFHLKARALRRKLATDVIVSCLATMLAIALFSNLATLRRVPELDGRKLAPKAETLAAREPRESPDDFLERVARSHVASLKAPPEIETTTAGAASAAVSPPPRQSAARRTERLHSNKARPAVAAAEAPPPVQPPLVPPAPARPIDVAAAPTEADWLHPLKSGMRLVAAAAPTELDWLHPLQSGMQSGMRLVAGLDRVVAASKARIAEGVSSVGGMLASLGKTPAR